MVQVAFQVIPWGIKGVVRIKGIKRHQSRPFGGRIGFDEVDHLLGAPSGLMMLCRDANLNIWRTLEGVYPIGTRHTLFDQPVGVDIGGRIVARAAPVRERFWGPMIRDVAIIDTDSAIRPASASDAVMCNLPARPQI